MTLEEAQASLIEVNKAISDIIAGKRTTDLQISTGYTKRIYKFSDTTLQDLKDYRRELIELISTLALEAPVFRINASIPLKMHKSGCGG